MSRIILLLTRVAPNKHTSTTPTAKKLVILLLLSPSSSSSAATMVALRPLLFRRKDRIEIYYDPIIQISDDDVMSWLWRAAGGGASTSTRSSSTATT